MRFTRTKNVAAFRSQPIPSKKGNSGWSRLDVAPAMVASAETPKTVDGSIKEATEKGTTGRPDASRHEDRESEPAVPLRVERIAEKLRGILQELSGMRPSDVDESATFLEMGFDSLFLAQFSRRLETEFGVAVNFGQLGRRTTDPECSLPSPGS